MAKPTQTTEWASDASYVEPTAGKKITGFDPAERPPAQYLDWLFYTIESWLAWLDTIEAPAADVEPVTLSADGTLEADGCHGLRTLQIPGLAGTRADFGDDWDPNGNNYAEGSSASGWVIPIPVREGDRILAVRAYIQDNLGVAITATLRAITHLGAGSTIGSPAVSAGAGGTDQTLTIGSLTEAVDGTESYILRLTPAGGALCRVYAVEVDYDRPR